MSETFNPHPIVAVVKIFLMAALLSVLLFLAQDYLGDIFLNVLLLIWLIAIFYIFVAFIAARFHMVSIDENGITYNSGILSIRRIIIPYSRITEASYTQGLVQRLFGVGTLNVDSAGGSNMAIHVNDIKFEHLKKVLDMINRRSGKGDGT
ncbi:MAG: PH domain-containing protein [Candidatus Micrarchaeota archaeon]